MHSIIRLLILISALVAACGKVVPVEEECITPETSCDGVCVNQDMDPDNCGACGNACAGDEVCESGGCVPTSYVVEPRIVTAWPDTTGWLTPGGEPIEMRFAPVNAPGATFQCRTGHVSIVASLPFTPCDGQEGRANLHRPVPNGNLEEGRYRTEMRVLLDTTVSDVVSYEYYVHHSLSGVPACLSVFTDDQAFAAAAQVLDTQTQFGPGMELRNPFVRIPFVNVNVTWGMINGDRAKWSTVGPNYTAELNSLRRQFTVNGANNLLLVKRRYASRQGLQYNPNAACRNGFYFGNSNTLLIGGPAEGNIDCQYFVLNARGESVCLIPNPQMPTQLMPRLTSKIGYVKLQRQGSFSAKGPEQTCPPKFQSACTWYLELPL